MVLWAAIGVLGVAAQGAISFFNKPAWVKKSAKLDSNWRRVAIGSTLAALVILGFELLLAKVNDFNPYTAVFVGITAFLVFQSFITDISLRYVDRWVMNLANVIALAMGVFLLYNFRPESELVVYAVFSIAATALLFFPIFGQSDARAFQLMVFALYPLYGVAGIQYALAGMLIAIVIYYIAQAIHKGDWAFNKLFTKLSFPMVPLILAPVLLVLLFGRWIPTF
jgi:hypothetical protein